MLDAMTHLPPVPAGGSFTLCNLCTTVLGAVCAHTFCSHGGRRGQPPLTCPDAFGKVMASLEDTRGGELVSTLAPGAPSLHLLSSHPRATASETGRWVTAPSPPVPSARVSRRRLSSLARAPQSTVTRLPVDGPVLCTPYSDHS